MGNVSYAVPSIHPMIQVAPPGVPIHTPAFAGFAGGPRATGGARRGQGPGLDGGRPVARRRAGRGRPGRVGGVGGAGRRRRAAAPGRGGHVGSPAGAAAPYDLAPYDGLRQRGLHPRRGRRPPAVLHQPRRAGVRPRQPARGGEGGAVRPLLALAQEPAPAVPRRVRGRPRHRRRRHRRRHRRAAAGRGALRPGLLRVRRRLGGPARRRAPGVRAGVEPADQGARVGPAHVVPRAEHPLHRLRRPPRRPLPLLPRPRGAGQPDGPALRGRPRPHVRHLRRDGRDDARLLPRALPQGPRRQRLRAPPGAQGQGARRRAGRPAGARCRTSASTAPGRPTRRCCCACGPTRCPRPAATPTSCSPSCARSSPASSSGSTSTDRGVAGQHLPGDTRTAMEDIADKLFPDDGAPRPAAARRAGRVRPRRRGAARRRHALPLHRPARGRDRGAGASP